jgi:SAM-dependent methyltransferase
MSLTFSQRCFALLCNKNVKDWEQPKEEVLPPAELLGPKKQEWIQFWKKLHLPTPNFHDRTVVDYGCGYGYDSLFMLQAEARHVFCLEISERRLDYARRLHRASGFDNVTYLISDNVKTVPTAVGADCVDVVISRDVMEHVRSVRDVLDSMYAMLKPGGEAYIGFSPLYKSPYGAHIRSFCKIPWIHLVFSEDTVLKVFKHLYRLPPAIQSYVDIEGSGVNKLSYLDYKEMIESSNWKVEADYVNQFPHRPILMKIWNYGTAWIPPGRVKELFLVSSYMRLRK